MEFRTKYAAIYDKKKRFRPPTNPGSPIIDIYNSRFDKDGHIEVYVESQRNLQEYIDSFYEDCLLENMIDRFMRGDLDALDRVKGSYFDATDFPTTIADMYNRVSDANKQFESLPPDIREAFNNNPVEFYTMYGSPEFDSIISSVLDINDDSIPNLEEKEIVANE